MGKENFTRTTLGDDSTDPDLVPDSKPNSEETLNPANDERSLDVGESGQFAPGGYYNQHGAAEADRLDLDKFAASRTPDKGE